FSWRKKAPSPAEGSRARPAFWQRSSMKATTLGGVNTWPSWATSRADTKSETAARLSEVSRLFGCGGAAEGRIAMRETAETGDHVMVTPGVIEEAVVAGLFCGQGGEQGDRAFLVGQRF